MELFDEDGASLDSGSGSENVGTGNAFDVRLQGATDVDCGGFYIEDSAFLAGPVRFDPMLVDTSGTPTDDAWTGTDVDVDDIPHDGGTTVISSNTTGQRQGVQTTAAPNITSDDTIYAVKGHLFAERDTNPDAAIQATTRTSDGLLSGASGIIPAKDDYDHTDSSIAHMTEDPPSSPSVWTKAILDTFEPGVTYTQAQSRTVNVTQIVGTAAYQASADAVLDAAGGSVAITGSTAGLKVGRKVAAASGSIQITGTAVALVVGLAITAASGSIQITGTAADLKLNRNIVADSGSVNVTGSTVERVRGRTIVAASGSIQITGTAASLDVGRGLGAGSGSVQINGSTAALRAARRIPAASGPVQITGSTVELVRGARITASSGSVDVSGSPAGLVKDSILSAGSGSVSLSGSVAGLAKGFVLSAESGTINVTGSTAGLIYSGDNETIDAQSGTINVTGSTVGMIRGSRLAAVSGSVNVTGTDVSFVRGRTLVASTGSIDVTGSAAGLVAGRRIAAASGAIEVVGSTAGLTLGRSVAAATGSVQVSGSTVGLKAGRVLSAGFGTVEVVGKDATLIKAGAAFTLTADSGTIQVSAPFGASLRHEGGILVIQDTIQLADEIAKVLNAAGLDEGIVYSRKFVPEFDPEMLADGPKAVCFPSDLVLTRASRRGDAEDHSCEVGIARKIDGDGEADTEKQLATVDEILETLREFSQQTIETTEGEELNFLGLETKLFVPEQLRKRVALSVIKVVYRGYT